MLTNKDEDIRTLIDASVESERAKRNIDTESNVQNHIFLNWKTTIMVNLTKEQIQ